MRIIYPVIIVCLYLAIPLIGYGLLGTMVTHKYQVDEARIFVEMDKDERSTEETQKELEAISKLEREILQTQVALVVAAILSFSLATGMIATHFRKNKVVT